MKRFTILAVAVISATFALDLEAVQKSSKRLYEYPLPIMEKRKIQNPSYADMYSVYKSDPLASRTSDSQQYYRRVQELLANIVAQKNRADPGWLENLRQREMNLRQLTDIRPPYDQDDFPAYSQMPQEDSLRWAPPLSQVVRPPPAEKHQASYRGHKQFPYSTRVPQEEMMKKRSVESKIDTQPKGLEATPKTEKKDDSKAGAQDHANATSGNKKMSPDEFKKWLTEEYYRNMAMSFATMRKKRSILEQGGGGGSEMSPSNRDEGLAFEKLRLMEDSLLEDALQDIMHGTPERHGTKKKPQVAGALDVAQDIENLKKILQSLVVDTQRLKAINEAEISAALKNVGRDAEPARDDETAECPELRMLMNGCSALRGMFPPDPIRGQFVASCNWHEVCYSCGAQHGISADQCDRSFLLDMRVLCGELGSCNPNLTSLLLTPLHKKRVFIKQNTLPICEKSCVVNFLART